MTQNSPSRNLLIPPDQSLTDISKLPGQNVRQPTTRSPQSTAHGSGGGVVRLEVNEHPVNGSNVGPLGYAATSAGKVIPVDIKRDRQMQPMIPCWPRHVESVINDVKWHKAANEDYTRRLSKSHEEDCAVELVQAKAALYPCPFECILAAVTMMAEDTPPRAYLEKRMSDAALDRFMELQVQHLEHYCYQAIVKGIYNFQHQNEHPYFPKIGVLVKFIKPIHDKLCTEVWALEKAIRTCHEKAGQLEFTSGAVG